MALESYNWLKRDLTFKFFSKSGLNSLSQAKQKATFMKNIWVLGSRIRDLKVPQNLGNFKCSVGRYFTPAYAHASSVRIHE